MTILVGNLRVNYLHRTVCLQDLDNVVKGLLSETGKSNEFIRNAAEEALMAMAENVTPQRAMIALVQEGARYNFLKLRIDLLNS